MEETEKNKNINKEANTSKIKLKNNSAQPNESERVDTQLSNKSGFTKQKKDKEPAKKQSSKVTITKVDYPLKQRGNKKTSTLIENDTKLVEKTITKSEITESPTHKGMETSQAVPHVNLKLAQINEDEKYDKTIYKVNETEERERKAEDEKNERLKEEIETKEYIYYLI